MGTQKNMRYLFLDLRFSGGSTFDQPLLIRAAVSGRSQGEFEYEKRVELSRGQIIDPRMDELLPPKKLPDDIGSYPEHMAARSFHEFLQQFYLNTPDGEGVCWIGDFYGYNSLHQLRAFFIRHGLNPFFGFKNTYSFDTSYLTQSEFKGDSCEKAEKISKYVTEEIFAEGKELIIEKIKSRKQIYGRFSDQSEANRGAGFFEDYPRAWFHETSYYPVSHNGSGAILFDVSRFYEKGNQKTKTVKDLFPFIAWMNFSSTVWYSTERKPAKLFNYIGNIGEHEYPVLKANIKKLLSTVKTTDYFELLKNNFKGQDPEIFPYAIDPGNLHRLKSAIYNSNLDSITDKASGKVDPALGLLYMRHLSRIHKWSDKTYLRSDASEDRDAKKVLGEYAKNRYFNSSGEGSMPFLPPVSYEKLGTLYGDRFGEISKSDVGQAIKEFCQT